MPSQDSERFKRIRDRQLQARDPLTKQRKQDAEIARKQRRMQGSFSFGRMWRDIPRKWRGALVGALIGLAILFIAPTVIEGGWGTCVGTVALPFAALVGFLIGRYEDTMQDIKDHLH